MAHPYPPYAASERETLRRYLDYYRALLLDKAGGLTDEQLHTRLEPSTLTLGNLLHHMAVVEHWWFNEAFAGNDSLEPWASAPWDEDRDWDFNIASELDTAVIIERYEAAVAMSQEIESAADSLDILSVKTRKDEHWSLRWIMVHMIEEYARHTGHADLIRESIDGETGDFRDD